MSNKSYLCCTDYPDICPSLGMTGFDATEHVRAVGVYCVPLAWLALFGPDSLVTKVIQIPGNEELSIRGDGTVEVISTNTYSYTITAPIASRELCIDRLESNIPLLETLLQQPAGSLALHGACLQAALEQSPGEYATIELQEISCMEGETNFFVNLRMVLEWFEGIENPQARRAARALGDLDLNRPIGPPRSFSTDSNLGDIDARNQENLIGSGYHDVSQG